MYMIYKKDKSGTSTNTNTSVDTSTNTSTNTDNCHEVTMLAGLCVAQGGTVIKTIPGTGFVKIDKEVCKICN